MSKPTAVIQQITLVEGNEYQILFTQIVNAYGMAVIGINVPGQDIREDDIRVGDQVAIGKNTDGLYIASIDMVVRAAGNPHGPFFPPEPDPDPRHYGVAIIGVEGDTDVDLGKTLDLTVRGVLANAGLTVERVHFGELDPRHQLYTGMTHQLDEVPE
jgi:hypothetical protein